MKSPQSGASADDAAASRIQTIVVQSVSEPVAADHLTVTVSFLSSPNPSQKKAYPEEDSTDIYTLERCSPLNDF